MCSPRYTSIAAPSLQHVASYRPQPRDPSVDHISCDTVYYLEKCMLWRINYRFRSYLPDAPLVNICRQRDSSPSISARCLSAPRNIHPKSAAGKNVVDPRLSVTSYRTPRTALLVAMRPALIALCVVRIRSLINPKAGAIDGADATPTPGMIRNRSAKSNYINYLTATLKV